MSDDVVGLLETYGTPENPGTRAVKIHATADGSMTLVPGELLATLRDTDGAVAFQSVNFETGGEGYLYDDDGPIYDRHAALTDSRVEHTDEWAIRSALKHDLNDADVRITPILRAEIPAEVVAE